MYEKEGRKSVVYKKWRWNEVGKMKEGIGGSGPWGQSHYPYKSAEVATCNTKKKGKIKSSTLAVLTCV